MIDRRFVWAAGFSFLAAALALVGLIHGDEVSLSPDDVQAKLALGYAFMGLVCLAFSRMGIPERELDHERSRRRRGLRRADGVQDRRDVPEEQPALQPA